MEIGLPDDAGREQIWKIHTAKVNDSFIEIYTMKFSLADIHEDARKQNSGSCSAFERDG